MSEQNKTAIQLAAEKVTPPPTKAQLIKAAAAILHQENNKKRAAHEELIKRSAMKLEAVVNKTINKVKFSGDYNYTSTHNGRRAHRINIDSWINVGDFPELDAAVKELVDNRESAPAYESIESYIKRLKAASSSSVDNTVDALTNDPDIRKKLAEAATQLLNTHENKRAIKV